MRPHVGGGGVDKRDNNSFMNCWLHFETVEGAANALNFTLKVGATMEFGIVTILAKLCRHMRVDKILVSVQGSREKWKE